MEPAAHHLFDNLPVPPLDPILGSHILFKADPALNKVNLGIGVYRTDAGEPYLFKSVQKVEETILNEQTNKEYLPIDGLASLKQCTAQLLFGIERCPFTTLCSIQTLSGTGAIMLAAKFIQTFLPLYKTALISNPSWPNHQNIFKSCGYNIQYYPYWNPVTKELDFEGLVKTFEDAPENSVAILQTSAHNPTGIDPTVPQWRKICEIVKSKGIIPILDVCYQGFATGDLCKDAFPLRLFYDENVPFFACQSFAKNMGLYGERIGMLHVKCNSKDETVAVLRSLNVIIRTIYSSPPLHGARIVEKILGDKAAYDAWVQELKTVTERLRSVRKNLQDGLNAKAPNQWNHIGNQQGMFAYTGLTKKQCHKMTQKWHIYLLDIGRVALTGVNSSNINYVIDAIDDCSRQTEKEA